jgi:hypothetical protein
LLIKRCKKAPHHKNKDGFVETDITETTTEKYAARGYEQLLYEKFGKGGKIAE